MDGWVERWLQTLPVEDVHREIAQFEARIAELQAEIDKRRELLAMRERWLDGGASEAEAPEPATPAPEPSPPARPTRADALLRLLTEDPDRTWKLSDVRTELVARGWLEDTREASASLQVTASKLTRAGRIVRPGAGRYRAAEPGEAAA